MDHEISFRPLTRADFPLLLRWLAEPHVDRWWHESTDYEGLEAHYGPGLDGHEPTYVFIIEQNARPIGWIQWYRWSDYADHAAKLGAEGTAAGVDLAIGEPELIGKGIGPRAIREFVARFIFVDPQITAVVSDPEELNVRSLRGFEKAEFDVATVVRLDGETVWRRVVRLERDGRSGRR